MCNLYSVTTNVEAIRAFVRDMRIDEIGMGNFAPQTGIFPDYLAPIVRNFGDVRELTRVRWGMPSSSVAQFEAAKKRAQKLQQKWGRDLTPDEFKSLLENEPDSGVTNVRNTASKHWQRWLSPDFRCVVPFTSFSSSTARKAMTSGSPSTTADRSLSSPAFGRRNGPACARCAKA